MQIPLNLLVLVLNWAKYEPCWIVLWWQGKESSCVCKHILCLAIVEASFALVLPALWFRPLCSSPHGGRQPPASAAIPSLIDPLAGSHPTNFRRPAHHPRPDASSLKPWRCSVISKILISPLGLGGWWMLQFGWGWKLFVWCSIVLVDIFQFRQLGAWNWFLYS